MYHWCCYLIWANFILAFWAKGTIIFHSPGVTTWYRGMPFYGWQVDFPEQFIWHLELITVNLALFALLQILLNIIIKRSGQVIRSLNLAWLLLLLLANGLNLTSFSPCPSSFILLELIFWGYLEFQLIALLFGSQISHHNLSETENAC